MGRATGGPLPLLLLCAVLLTASLTAADIILIPRQSVWSYDDTGDDAISAGYQLATFDDSTWLQAQGPLGYGYNDLLTVVSFGTDNVNKYLTTFFRKVIDVTDPAVPTVAVNMSVQLVHGARCFINGMEVYRNNMPSGAVTYLSTAQSGVTKPTVALAYKQVATSQRLVMGTNVIACDVHLASSSSAAMRFDLFLAVSGVDASSPSPSPVPTSVTPSASKSPAVAASASPSRAAGSSTSTGSCVCVCATLACCTTAQAASCGASGSVTTQASSSSSSSSGGAIAAGVIVPIAVIAIGYYVYKHRSRLVAPPAPTSAGGASPHVAAEAATPTGPYISRQQLLQELSSINVYATHSVPPSRKKSKRSGRRRGGSSRASQRSRSRASQSVQ